MLRYLLLLGLIISLFACGPEVIYEKQVEFPDSGWSYADSVRFDFTVPETTLAYDLILDVNHGVDFPYENFYVQLHTLFPSGKRQTQQLSLQLAGDFGEFLGNCSGQRCSLTIPVLSNARFGATGTYAITLQQYSRDEPLPEVRGVGLRVVKAEPGE